MKFQYFSSQVGQDEWVCKMLNYKPYGYFVDIGANDGITINNTYCLEKELNWRGLCVEPSTRQFNKLLENRSCTCINKAVAGENGTVRFKEIEDDVYAGVISDSGYEIEAITLEKLLTDYNAPKDIDYISIDVEGTEYEIIKDFPFGKYRVKLWTIEHNQSRDNIRRRMVNNGYSFVLAKKVDHDEGFYFK
jgi:FkbM family methyltransferase